MRGQQRPQASVVRRCRKAAVPIEVGWSWRIRRYCVGERNLVAACWRIHFVQHHAPKSQHMRIEYLAMRRTNIGACSGRSSWLTVSLTFQLLREIGVSHGAYSGPEVEELNDQRETEALSSASIRCPFMKLARSSVFAKQITCDHRAILQ